ncbi:MAG: carboxypeptidase regulatory-like domain-containing protein [Sphingobacteriales bacterium]|nr:MAG: carboxypeptidase regulatory-like domain-containing protein [Sphingobacteriales bacterium]
MNRTLPVIIFAFSTTIVIAQKNKTVIKGRLVDILQKQQLDNATISLINAKDSSLIGFTRTDAEGRFVIVGVNAG